MTRSRLDFEKAEFKTMSTVSSSSGETTATK
jgi:hypothetical protein